MRQRELIHQVGAVELSEWMSYDLSNQEDFRKSIAVEKQKNTTAEQRATQIKEFFERLQCQSQQK